MNKRALFLFLGIVVIFALTLFFNINAFCVEQDLKVSVDTLDFGHAGITKQVYLTNKGTDSLSWSTRTDAPWLSVEPASGRIESPQSFPADAQYYFSYMWPRLPQPWYFDGLRSVGIDHEGSIYVGDGGRYSIRKFNKYEEFLFDVGSDDYERDDYLPYAYHIAFDSRNNLYVTIPFQEPGMIKKFGKNGNFIKKITKKVDGQEVSYTPWDIAIDSQDNIYTTDYWQKCVDKFDKDGNYLKSWGRKWLGGEELGDGEFYDLMGIVIDSENFVYIADNHYTRIQKFDSEGNFIKMWGFKRDNPRRKWGEAEGGQWGEVFAIDSQDIIYVGHEHSFGMGKFDTNGNNIGREILYPSPADDSHVGGHYYLNDAAVDEKGNIYLCSPNPMVIKYDPQGNIIAKWKDYSEEDGMFSQPWAMAINKRGDVYVYDSSFRMQIFDSEGNFVTKWDFSSEEFPPDLSEARYVEKIAFDSLNNVFLLSYASDYPIFKFDVNGNFISKNSYEQFGYISALAIDSRDNLYIGGGNSETEGVFLLKLDRNGNVIKEWDNRDVEESSKINVTGLIIDSQDNLYIFGHNPQTGDGRALKFSPNGDLIRQWQYPDVFASWGPCSSLAIDSDDNIYTAFLSSVKKFDSDGQLLISWGEENIGYGYSEGDLSLAEAIAIGPQDRVYVAEERNNRIQVFSQAAMPVTVSLDRTNLQSRSGLATLSFYNDSEPSAPPLGVQVIAKTELPLKLLPIGNKIIDENRLLRFTVLSNDPANEGLTFSATNLPPGATFDPTTRIFSWKPNYSQAGSYLVTFTVSDGLLSDSETITITVNNVNTALPGVGSISPASGSSGADQPVAFITTYSDADGWGDIRYGYLLVNTAVNGKNCFYGYYNQNTNKLYLRNDDNTAWIPSGGYTPGSSNVIENSYAKLDYSQTTVSGSGNKLTVKWSVIFKSSFVGVQVKNTRLKVVDDAGAYNGWTQKGTWLVGANSTPSVGTITPSSGSSPANTAVNFTTTYSDPNGWRDIQQTRLLINTKVNGTNCFYGYYNQNQNKLYLRNNANTTWLGGFAPGSSNVIQNSYVKLNCAQTTVSGSGNTLTVRWNITFKPAFKGQKNTYLYIKDDSNAYDGWKKKGTWEVK